MNILKSDNSRLPWVFAAIFIILGVGYATLTPIFENSDETLHYPYVKYLADGYGLPLAIPNQLWNQEATQPPLYYAIVAATTFWINTNNLTEFLQYNPHWLFTDVRPRINDNQNRVIHGPMDTFPYHRAALAIHIGRWWSLFFGLVTVVCTFFIARRLFYHNLPLAVSATALTALTPQFIRVSATVSNDSLSAALASFSVLLALIFTKPHQSAKSIFTKNIATGNQWVAVRFTNKHALLLGFLAGLALLTKLSSLTTFFLVAAIIFWRLFFLSELHERPFQKIVQWLLIAAAVVILLNGWWFLRNYRLYGEWLATETHLNLAGRGYLSLPEIWKLRHEVERAYWGTFGWGQIRLPEWMYGLLGLFTRIGILGLVLALVTKLVQGDKKKPIPLNVRAIQFEPIIFLLFWATLNLVLYLQWVSEVGSVSHTRLIFPAITAISLLLALGWHALLPRRAEGWFSGVLAAGLVALNIYSLGWLISPAFTPHNESGQTAASQHMGTLDVTFLDSLKLLDGNVTIAPTPLNKWKQLTDPKQMAVSTGDRVTVSAQWQVITPIDKNYSVAITLLSPDGAILAQRETYPGLGLRPTRYIQPNQPFTDSYSLKLTKPITEPFIARAAISLFDIESADRTGFPAMDAAGNNITPVVGQIKIVPKNWPQHHPNQEINVTFANAINLTGYDLPRASNILTLYWRSTAPLDKDYNLFIHLLDKSGNIIAQADAPPTGNAYPTSWWVPGETIADRHALPNAPNATHLRVGLYSLSTGQRLPISQSSLPIQDSGVEIKLPQ